MLAHVGGLQLGHGRDRELLRRGTLADQLRLGLARPPRLGAHTTERQPCVLHDALAHVERRGHGHERELVGLAVAELQVEGLARERQRWQLDRDDQLAVLDRVLQLRRVARQ